MRIAKSLSGSLTGENPTAPLNIKPVAWPSWRTAKRRRLARTIMLDEGRIARALYREDLSCFVERVFRTLEPGKIYHHNWHIDHIAWQLMRVARGEIKRLVINVPPRS